MKKNFLVEIIISAALIIILLFFINPLGLLIPMQMHPFMVPFLILIFVVFSALLWGEAPGDERESLHKFIASRFAYFAGVLALIIGIVSQSFKSEIDPFLIIAICVMLLAKILGLIYGHFKH